MSKHLPTTLPVEQIVKENYRTATLTFANQLGEIRPGQFVMLWLPGVNEKPVSVAFADSKIIELTVSAVGPWSQAVQKVKIGTKLGLRGPFGNTFKLPKSGRIALVGGGFGVAPLHFLAHAAKKQKIKVDFIVGAKNKKELLYTAKAQKISQLHVTTDDGSVGLQGFATAKLAELLANQKYAAIYSCGPEVMMRKIAELAKAAKIQSQLSLERYMKCGFGLCGSCCLDSSGSRVCADGTIYSGEKVLKESEFGQYHRDSCGRRV
jgi:dihydroorotate dehydrogenase electron transfer subunit